MSTLKDKVVVITGASSGIGKAAAIKFAHKQCKVVLAARRIERLRQLSDQIRHFNDNCIYVQTDVTSEDDVTRLFEAVEKQFGGIDILVNNAGKGLKAELTDIKPEDWQSLMDTNVTSVYNCTRHAVIIMKENNTPGRIINVSSLAGRFGAPTYSAYCASKHAVTGMTKALKWELRKYKIRISAIHPARADTEFFDSYEKKPGRKQMLGSGDIADAVIAIASGSYLRLTGVRILNFFKRIYYLVSS
ncbi:MAG: SDR family oxidoreductase [Planctomycetota bacterium]|jgi:NAD(P)-dependent dehydrogenase (short-subunit alcohol dehydrogenase family)